MPSIKYTTTEDGLDRPTKVLHFINLDHLSKVEYREKEGILVLSRIYSNGSGDSVNLHGEEAKAALRVLQDL